MSMSTPAGAKKRSTPGSTNAGNPPSAPRGDDAASRPGTAALRPVPTHEQIAQCARAIWQSKGCPVGQDEQNWREAETQLRSRSARN